MPDWPLLLAASGAAAGLAASVALLTALASRGRASAWAAVGGAAGAGGGFFLGGWLLSRWAITSRLRWPPAEDQDRFLLLLLPAAVATEALAALVRRPRWAGVAVRLPVAAAAARVLLDGTTYLA